MYDKRRTRRRDKGRMPSFICNKFQPLQTPLNKVKLQSSVKHNKFRGEI